MKIENCSLYRFKQLQSRGLFHARNFVLLLILLSSFSVAGQPFNVSVAFEKTPRGKVSLFIYDTDTIPRVMHKKVVDGTVSFTGQLAHPCYAEVATAKGQRMGFFMECSDITIRFNEDNPESSPVNGSRINSQYRYTLEKCRGSGGEYDLTALTEEVSKNKSTVFASYIIYRHLMPSSNKEKLAELMALLEGEATKSYHYKLLTKQLESVTAITEGAKMPDIIFTDAKNNSHHTDSLMSDSSFNLLIVGATWCRQCSDAKDLVDQEVPNINTIVINIDYDKRVWDAEVIRKLQIEHIPYLILIAPDKTIAERDIRAWELKRKFPRTVRMPQQKKDN